MQAAFTINDFALVVHTANHMYIGTHTRTHTHSYTHMHIYIFFQQTKYVQPSLAIAVSKYFLKY